MSNRQKTAVRNSKIQTLIKRDMDRCINLDDALRHVLEYGVKGYRNMTLAELEAEIEGRT